MTNTDQGHLFQSSIFQEQNICTDLMLVTSCTLHRFHVFYANLVVSALPLWSVALVFNTRGDDDILILFGCCSRPLVWRHLRQGKCKVAMHAVQRYCVYPAVLPERKDTKAYNLKKCVIVIYNTLIS